LKAAIFKVDAQVGASLAVHMQLQSVDSPKCKHSNKKYGNQSQDFIKELPSSSLLSY